MWRKFLGLICLCLAACGESGREPVVHAPPPAVTPAALKVAQAASDAMASATNAMDSGMPAKEQIIDWWKKKSDEEFEVFDVKAVRLLSREPAYLAGVRFGARGRTFQSGAVLIRPDKEDIIEIKSMIGSEFKVMDLDGDGISEIVTRIAGSGQGTVIGERYILHLQNDTPLVLHKAGFSEGSRIDANDNTENTSTTVEWKFSSEDNTPVLQELIVGKESLCPAQGTCQEKTTQQSNTYRFINRQFIKSANTP